MHIYKTKPKRFFYFLDTIIKKMPEIRNTFYACRILLTGKLKGGTARTDNYLVGFGNFPRQTLINNIHVNFKAVESKYGSYGIKLITWRKELEKQLISSTI
jgi:ribosomal protein S3